MILKKLYGVSPDLDISIGDVPVNYESLGYLELHLSENQHDMLVLRMVGLPSQAITDYLDKGVYLSMGTGASYKQVFCGYVTDVRPKSVTGQGFINDSPFQEADVVCLGASYMMRGKKSKNWTGYRLSEVVEEMSSHYGFSADVPNYEPANGTLTQTNESDWQFLVRYSNLLGLSINAHGTHVHVYDPYKSVGRQSSYHRLTTVAANRGDISPTPGQVLSFDGSFARRHADGQYIDTVVAVLSDTLQTYDVTTKEVTRPDNGVPYYENRISDFASSYEHALRIMESSNKQDYDYVATVEVLGVAGCVPGGVVSIDNYNGEFDGFWYVRSVKHKLHSDAFVSELEIVRNTNSQLDFYNLESFQTPPTPRYNLGMWKPSKRYVNVYS